MAIMDGTVDGRRRSGVATTDSAGRAYRKEFGIAMLVYVVVVFLSTFIINAHSHAPWRFPLALAPMVPATFALWAFVRHLRRIDELQRRIQFEALSIAFGGTALLTFSYGFVENVGFPHLNWFFVWPLMAVLWMLGLALTSRRYR